MLELSKTQSSQNHSMSIPEAARALDGLVRAVSLLICFLVFSVSLVPVFVTP